MKDGIVLHPEHGLNPSIELCIVCGEEMGIALLGNNIKGQAPHHICTGEICDNCKKIIDMTEVVLLSKLRMDQIKRIRIVQGDIAR